MSFPAVIFHNPRCSKSRAALQALLDAGLAPEVIDYRAEGWSRPLLLALFAASGVTPREALRDAEARAAGLDPDTAEDAAILSAMIADPGLVNRPFVVTPKGACLCRPSERIAALLP